MKYAFLVLGFSVFTAAACSSSSNNNADASGGAGTTGSAGTTGGAGTGEAGTTAGGAGTTGTAGTGAAGTGAAGTGAAGTTACTAIGHTGPEAPEVAGVGTFPTPAGGAVVDGTYDLKEFRIYPPGSVDPYKRQETLKFAAGKIEQSGKSYDGKESSASGTYTVNGAEATLNVTCPGTMSIKLPYTATATEFWLFDTSPGNMEVHVYTKRP